MKLARRTNGLKVNTAIKSGGLNSINHNRRAALKVRTGVKSGGLNSINHNVTVLSAK